MNSRVWTIIGVTVVLLALGGSMWLLFGPGSAPYLGVDDLLQQRQEMVNRPIRLAGRLQGEVVRTSPEAPVRFVLAAGEATIAVEYAGTVPVNLDAGRELLLDGRLRDDDVFVADNLLTQCTSRYEARIDGAAE